MMGLHGGMRIGDESGTKKTICDSQKRAPALDWTMPPFVKSRKENENRVFACTTSNYSGFFSMVKPGSSSSTSTETAKHRRKRPVRQVLERLPPVSMAWRSACQASLFVDGGRFFWEKVLEMGSWTFPTSRLLCAGGAWWEPEQCRFVDSLWQSRAWIVFNRYHSLTWQISWKVQSQNQSIMLC